MKYDCSRDFSDLRRARTRKMAGFAAQAALRSKWGDLVDSGAASLPEPSEAISGLKNVVGWLKQVSLI